jgi:hypothetical protein
MSEREGASPDGEAPDRVSAGDPAEQPTVRRGEPVESVEPGESVESVESVQPAEPNREPILPPIVPPGESFEGSEGPADDPFEQYRPAEPTLRADPSAREFDVPFDTGQLRRLSTGQLLVVHRPDGIEATAVEVDSQRRVYSWIAAIVGTLGAVASLFVGWMLPLSIAAIVFGVLGLRREDEGRTLAFVGIGTGVAGLVFSAVWIGYYAIVFGALPH